MTQWLDITLTALNFTTISNPMARRWTQQATIRRAILEGFRAGRAQCTACGFRWTAIIRPETVAWKLPCPSCKNTPEMHNTISSSHFVELHLKEQSSNPHNPT